MSRNYNPVYGGYGAFEMKAAYQRNMLIGIAVTVLFATFVIGTIMVLQLLLSGPTVELAPPSPPIDDDFGTTTSNPPPIVISDGPHIASGGRPPKAELGTKPILVADSLMGSDAGGELPTDPDRAEYGLIYDPGIDGAGEGTGGGNYGGGVIDEYPDPYEFRENVQLPKMLQAAVPEFPRLAKAAGMSGTVWVRVLVDEEGHVLDAFVEKSTNEHAGFEEAALEAAYECIFSPGIQNGISVKVWVSFKFEFDLVRSN